MTATAKPLNKKQRDRADRARKAHEEVVRLTAQADAARAKRDALVAALLADGVRPFALVNETGVPATTMLGLVRKARLS